MKVTVLLCDSAQVADGKLHLLGGGWNITGPGPTTHAVAVLLEVPWDRTNRQLDFTLELVTDDGSPFMQIGPDGSEVPTRIEGGVEVGRPPGHPHGAPINVPFVINIPGLQLEPGRRYSWEAHVTGEPDNESWHAAFSTRPLPATGPADFRISS
jgi:hypothetical protein